jgi:hypothetical protein
MVGRVGYEAILVRDVLTELKSTLDKRKEQLDQNGEKPPAEQWEAQRVRFNAELLKAVDDALAATSEASLTMDTPEERAAKAERRAMLKQMLKQQIEAKLIYQDLQKTIPAEGFSHAEKQLKKQFDDNELPKLLKQAGVDSWRELDQWFHDRDSSLERERDAFIQHGLVQTWLWEQVKADKEITYDQMVAYYRDHPAEFDKPARTRWQELAVVFSQVPSKQEAWATIVDMGNQVLRGADFAQVAQRAASQGVGSAGSLRDWPDKSGMVSPMIQRAIEELPVGHLSPILEDSRGFHIVRVAERRPAGRIPFESCQPEIRKKVKNHREEEQIQTYLAKLQKQTPVWTILDDHPEMARRNETPSRYY